ncbi:hypothetical protein [Chitinophaga sp. S165]|uniref:hypothetical protein n=1 Tax=Chitinophaga sp. S165 TaxID=2135462 RepID=UPI000D70F5ED|nr:hypothetical protein [Chitinophaga sp. S165]PWV55523.1 hypothetical protein C7475_10129 [Chitinophaga sp. S165]
MAEIPRGEKIIFSVIMEIELGKHLKWNQRKLDKLPDQERAWAAAIEKCRRHINIRLYKKTHFGAHAEARLGMDAMDYYVGYAIDAVLDGRWQWKDEYTLSQQLTRIAESVISKEVEKYETERKNQEPIVVSYNDLETLLYDQEAIPPSFNDMDQMILEQKIEAIESIISGDTELEVFWDSVKEGGKPAEIAVILEMTPHQVYKLRDRFKSKIQTSPYFESEFYAKDK